MDKRVDKGEDFKKSGMTLITEVESDQYLRKVGKRKKEQKEEIFDNQAEWADGFCGK
jgi:hypothetical protein